MFCIQNAYRPKLLDSKVELQRIISESGDASRKLISKQDHLSQFFDSDLSDINSGKIARSIERYIKRTRKYSRETKFFVESIVNKIYLLHKYNLQVSEITFKYPLSQDFIQLLLRYVALECLVLYRKENHTPKYESIVEHRILRLLQRIYISYFETLDNVKPDKVFKECYTAILNLIIKVKLEFEIHNDVMENIAKKLLTKMGRLEEINALTKRSLPCPLDTYLSDPALVRSCKSIITSDYGTDDDLKLEEEFSQVDFQIEEGGPSQDLGIKQEELSQVNVQMEVGDPSQDLDIKQDLSDLLLVSQRFHQQNSLTFNNVKHVPTIYIDDDIEQMISLEREFESSSRSLRRLEADKSSVSKDKLFEQFSNHKPFKEDIKPHMKEEVIDLDSEDESNTLPIPSGVNTTLEDESNSLRESALQVVVLDDEVIEDLDKSTSNCDLSSKLNEDVIELSSDEDESISIFYNQSQKQAIKEELVTFEADSDIVAEKTEKLNNSTEVHKSSAICAAAVSGNKSPGSERCDSSEHSGNDASKEINRKLEQAINSKPGTTKSNTVNVENPKEENLEISADTRGAKDLQTVSVEEVNPESIGNEEKPSNSALQGSNANAREFVDCEPKSLEAAVNNCDSHDKLILETDNEKEQLEKDKSEINIDELNLNKSPAVVKSCAKLPLPKDSKKAKNSKIGQTNKMKTFERVDMKLSDSNDEYCDNSNELLNGPSTVVEVTKMCQSNDAEVTTTDILRSSDTDNYTRAQNISLCEEGTLESVVIKESSPPSNSNTNDMVTSRISETGGDVKNVEGIEIERPEQSRSKKIELQVKTGIAGDGLKPNKEHKNDVNLLSVSLSVLDQPSNGDSSKKIELDMKTDIPDVLLKPDAEEQNSVNLLSDNRLVSDQLSDEKSSKEIEADVVEPNLEEQNNVNLSSVSDQSGDEKSSNIIGADSPNDVEEPTLEEQNTVNLSSINRSVSDQSSDEESSKKLEADGKTDDFNDVLEPTLEEQKTVNLSSINPSVSDQSSDEKSSKQVEADGKTDNLNDVSKPNLEEQNVNLSFINRPISDQSSDEKLSKKVEADGKIDNFIDVLEPNLEEQNANLPSVNRSVSDQSSDEKSSKNDIEPPLEEQNTVNLSPINPPVSDQSSDDKSSKKTGADVKTGDPNDVLEPTLEEQNIVNLSLINRSVSDKSSDEKLSKKIEADRKTDNLNDVLEPDLEEQNVNLSINRSVSDQSSDEKSSKKIGAYNSNDDVEPTLEEQNNVNLSSINPSVSGQSSDGKSSKKVEADGKTDNLKRNLDPNLVEQNDNSSSINSLSDQSSTEKSSKKVGAHGKTDDLNDVLEPTLEEQNNVNLSSINPSVSDQSSDEKSPKNVEADGKTDNLNDVSEPNLEERNDNSSSVNRSVSDQSSDAKSFKKVETGGKIDNFNDVSEPNLEERNNVNLSSNNLSVLVQSSTSEIGLEVKTDKLDNVLKPIMEEQPDQSRDENSSNETELEVKTCISQKVSKPDMEEQINVNLLAGSGSVSEELHNKNPSEKIELNAKRNIPKSNVKEQNNIQLLSISQSAQPDDENSSEEIVKTDSPDQVLKSNVGKQSSVNLSSVSRSVMHQAYDENKSKKIESNIKSDNPDDVLTPNTEQIANNLYAKGYMNQTSVRSIKYQIKTDKYASLLRKKFLLYANKAIPLMKKKVKIDESVTSKNGIRVTTITPSNSNIINQENIRADDIPNTFKEKKVVKKSNKKNNISKKNISKKQEKLDGTMLTIEKQGNDESYETESLNHSFNIGEERKRPLPKKEKNVKQTNCLLRQNVKPKQSEEKNVEQMNSLLQQEGEGIERAHCLLQQEKKTVEQINSLVRQENKHFGCTDGIITAIDGRERTEVFNEIKTLNKAPLETSFDFNHSIDKDLISIKENSSKNTENEFFDNKEIIPDIVSDNSKLKFVADEKHPDITKSPTLLQDVKLTDRKSNLLENERPEESSIANLVNDEVSEADVEKEQVFELEHKEHDEIEPIAMTDELIVLEEVNQNENLLIGESVAVPIEIEENNTDITPEVNIDSSDVNENTSDDYTYQIVENADACEEKYFFVNTESGLIDDLNIQKEEIVQTLESGLSKELIINDTVSQNCEEVLVNSQELIPACKDLEMKITTSDNIGSGIGTISKQVVRIVPNEENSEVASDEFIPDGNASLDLLATVASQVSRQNLSLTKKKKKRVASKRRKKQLGLEDKIKLVQKSNGRKKRRGRVQIGPEEIENKRVTRSTRIKTKIEVFQQDVKCKPDDFVINDSRVLPSAINIYTQKLPELPWTSEDSNDSEGHLLIDEGLTESVKSSKDIRNTCYDEDTMEENLVFQYQPKVKGTVLLSIPDTFQENFGEFLTHIEQLDRFTSSSDNKNPDEQDLQDNNSLIEATQTESGISDLVIEPEKKDTLGNGHLQKSVSETICRKPFRTKAAQKDYDKFSLKPYVSIERMNFASKEEERKYRQTRSKSFDIGIIRTVDNNHLLKEENRTYLDDEQLKMKTNRVHSTEPGVVGSETNQFYLANKLCDLQSDVKEKVKNEGLEMSTKRKEDSEDEIPLAERAHLEAKQEKKSVALNKCVPKKGKSDYKVNTGIKKKSNNKAKSKSPKNHNKNQNRDHQLVGRTIRKFISKEKISNLLNPITSKSSNSISPVSSSTATSCSKIAADSSITSIEKAPKSGEDDQVKVEINKRDPALETNSQPKCETCTYEEYIKNSNTIYYTTPKLRRKSVSKQNLKISGSTDVKLEESKLRIFCVDKKYYTPPKLRRKSVVESELVAENTELLKPADTPKTVPITTNVEILTKCKNTVSPTTEKLKSKLENDAKKNCASFLLIEEVHRYLPQNDDDNKADNLTSFDVLNCSKKNTEVEPPKSEEEITIDTEVKSFMEQNVKSKIFISDKPIKSGYDTMAATQTTKDNPDAKDPSVIVNRNSEVKYEPVSKFEINRNDKLIESGEENLDSLPLSERAAALQKGLTKSGIVEKLHKKKGVSSHICKRNTEKKAGIQKSRKSSKHVDLKFADDKISIDNKKNVASSEKGIVQSKKFPKSKDISILSLNKKEKLDKSDNCAPVVEVTLNAVNEDAVISRKEIMVEIKNFKENENIEEVHSTKINKVKEKVSSGTLSQGQQETDLDISVERNIKASPEKEHVSSVRTQEKRGKLSKVNIEKEENPTKTKEAGMRAKRTLSNINSKIVCNIKDINKDTIKSIEKIAVETNTSKKNDSNKRVRFTKLTEIKEQPNSYSDDSVDANVKASEKQHEKDDIKLQLEETSKINFEGENSSKTVKAGAQPKHTPIILNTNFKSSKEIMKDPNNMIQHENVRKGHPTKPQKVEEKEISGAPCQDQPRGNVENNVEKNIKPKSEKQPETETDLKLQSVEKVSKNIKKEGNLSKTIGEGPKPEHSLTNLNTKLKCSINKATIESMQVTETNNLKEQGQMNKVCSSKTTKAKVEELSEKLDLVQNETDSDYKVERITKIPSEKERKIKEVEETEKWETTNAILPDKCKNGEKLNDTVICPQEDETNNDFHSTEKHKLDIETSIICKTEHVEEVLTTIISDAALRQVGILNKATKITQNLNGDICPRENKGHKKDEANEKLSKSKKCVRKTETKGKQAKQNVAKNSLTVALQIVSDKQDVSSRVSDLGLDLTSVNDFRSPEVLSSVTTDDSCVVENKDLNTRLNGGEEVQVEKLDNDLDSKKNLNTESYVSISLKENSLSGSDHCNSLNITAEKENVLERERSAVENIAEDHSCEKSTMKEYINCDKLGTADQSQILFEESMNDIKTCTSQIQKDKPEFEENLNTPQSSLHSKECNVQNLPEKIPESNRTLSEKNPDANVNNTTSIQQVEQVTLKNLSVTEEVKCPNLKCQEDSQSLEAKEVIKKINSNLPTETAQDIKRNKGSRQTETVHIPYQQSENNMPTSEAKCSIENNLISEKLDGHIPKQAKNVKENNEEPQNPALIDMHSTSTKSDSDISIHPVVAPDVCYPKRKRRNSTMMEDNSDKKLKLSEINIDVSSSNLIQSSNIQSPKSVSPRKKDKKSIECIISQLKEEKGNSIDSHSETLNSQSTSLVTLDVGQWKRKLLQKIKSPHSHMQKPDGSKNNKIVATKAVTQQPSVSKSEIIDSNNAEDIKKTESGTVAEDSGKKTVFPSTIEIESEMKSDDNETDKDAISKVDILEEVQGSEVSKISNNPNCGNSLELNKSKSMKTVNDDNIDELSFDSPKNSFLEISAKVVCNIDMCKLENKTHSSDESVCLDLLDKNIKTFEEPPNPPSKDIESTLSEDTKISDLQNKNLVGLEIHSAGTPCHELKTISDISWIPDISISTPVNVAILDENTNMAPIQSNSAEEAAVEDGTTTSSFNLSKKSVSANLCVEIPSEKIITETVDPIEPFAITNSVNLSKESVSDNTCMEIRSAKISAEPVDPIEPSATANSFNLSKVSLADNPCMEIPSEKIMTETVIPVEPFTTVNSLIPSKESVSDSTCMKIPPEQIITETVISVFNPSKESVSDNTGVEIPSEKIVTETVIPVFNPSKESVSGKTGVDIPSEKIVAETVIPVEPFATTNSLNIYEKSVSGDTCMEIPSEQIICEPVNPIEPFSATNVDDTNLLNLCNLMSNEDIVGNVTRHIVESVSSETVCILSDIISTTMSSTDSKFPITSQAEIKNQFIPMNEVNSKKDVFDGRQVSTDNKNNDCLFSLNEQISNAGSSTLTTPSISLRLQDVPFSKIATGSSQTFDLISTNSIIQTSSESTFMSGIPVSTELTDIIENRCTNTMDHNYTIESLGGPLLSGRPEEEHMFPTTITKNAVDSTEEFSLIDNLLPSELSESDDTYKLTLDNDYAVENLVKLGGQSTDEENSFPVSNYNLEDIKRMNLIEDSISNSKDSCDSSDTIGASLTAPVMRENPWAQLITEDNLHQKVVPNEQCLKTPLHNLDYPTIPSYNDDGTLPKASQGAETRSDSDHSTKDKNPWSRFIANEDPSKKVVVLTNEQYLTPSFPIARDVFTKSSSFINHSFHNEDTLLMESRNGELKIDSIKSDSSSSVKNLVHRNKLVQQKPKRSKKISQDAKEDDNFLPRRSYSRTVLRPPPKKNAPPKTEKNTQPKKDAEETSANVRLTNEGLVLLTNTDLRKSVNPLDTSPCKKVRFDLPQSKSPAQSLAETLCQPVTVKTSVKKQIPQDVKEPISFFETLTEKSPSSKTVEKKSSDVKEDKQANVEDNAATWIENSPRSTFPKNGTVNNFPEVPNDASTKMFGVHRDIAELVKLRRRAASNRYSNNYNSPSPVRELKSDSIKSKKMEKPSLSRPRTATPDSKVDLIEQEHGSYQDEMTLPAKSNLEFPSIKVKPSPRTTTPESKPVSVQAESVQREHANSSGKSVRLNSPKSSLEFENGKFDAEKPKTSDEKRSLEMDGKRTVYPQSKATVARPCQSSSIDDYSTSRSQGTKRSLPAENDRCARKQIKVSPSEAHHLDINDIRFDSLRQQGNVNKLIRLRVTEDNKLKPERKFSPSLKLSRRDIDAGRPYNEGPDQNNVLRKEIDRRSGEGKAVTDVDRSLVDRSSPLTKLYGSSKEHCEHGKYPRSSYYRGYTSERQTNSSRSRSRNDPSPDYNHSSGSYSALRSQRSKSRSYSEHIKKKEAAYDDYGRTREGHEGHPSGSRGAWAKHHSDHKRPKDHYLGHGSSSTSRTSNSQHAYVGRSSNVLDTYNKANPDHLELDPVQRQPADNSGPYTKSGIKLTEEKQNELLKNVKDMVHKQLDSFGYKKDGAEGDFSWIDKVPLTEMRPQLTRPPNSSP